MPQDTLIGMVLGERYRLRRLIGIGTIGKVYLADHVQIRRRSAIKILRTEYLSDQSIVERFRREARAISRLDHRNIVRIEGFGHTDDGRLYLVMEYIRGPSLRHMLRDREPVPLVRSLSILKQLCDAVAFANRHEIIHRDLKPENLLLEPRRRRRVTDVVKVLDFGMAKILGGDSQTVTREGEVFGTPAYMAPEQCYGAEASAFTDQYAVGIIAYELIADRLPFEARGSIDFMVHHAQTTPEPPSKHRRDVSVPKSLDEAVLRALAKNPLDRWPNLEAFGHQLAVGLKELVTSSSPQVERFAADSIRAQRASSELELDPTVAVLEAARASMATELIDLRRTELAGRGSVYLFERYCQVVRLIAEQMRRLDLLSNRVSSLLADAVAAEELLLRAETELAIREAEAVDMETRIEAQLSEIHGQIVEISERRADARGAARRSLDRRLHEIEQQRADLETTRNEALVRLESQMDEHLATIAEHTDSMRKRHYALGDALDRRRRRGADFQLDEYYEMLDRVLAALKRATD